MKRKSLAVCLIVIGIFLTSGMISAAHAVIPAVANFKVTVTQNEMGNISPYKTFIAQIHFKAMDATTGTVSGYCPVSGDGPMILAGSYIVVGTVVYVNLTVTQKHTTTWRDAGVMQLQLNSTTLSGSFYQTRVDFNASGTLASRVFQNKFAAGTIAKQ